MIEKEILISNLDQLHTTKMGINRIKNNLCLDVEDVIIWCREKVENENSSIIRKGKNWYVENGNHIITINAHSYTIITAHKINRKF